MPERQTHRLAIIAFCHAVSASLTIALILPLSNRRHLDGKYRRCKSCKRADKTRTLNKIYCAATYRYGYLSVSVLQRHSTVDYLLRETTDNLGAYIIGRIFEIQCCRRDLISRRHVKPALERRKRGQPLSRHGRASLETGREA